MEKFAKSGDFCPNEGCPEYGQPQTDQQEPVRPQFPRQPDEVPARIYDEDDIDIPPFLRKRQ